MEENSSPTTKRSLFTRLLIFFRAHPLLCGVIILGALAISLVIGLAVAGGVGYLVYDHTQNNPKFCITCHEIMIESYETWEKSEHAEVNCHSCHYMTPEYAVGFPLSVLKGTPEKIPPRPEGKVIVPDKYCMKCHWDAEKQHGDAGEWVYFIFPETHVPENANKVTDSRFHALHFFMGPTACSICHGGKQLHTFTSAPEDCLDCHQDQQEKAHAAKAVELTCLNCHTDRTANLHPDREKCLFCHAETDKIRQELIAAGTIDVKYAQPSEETIANASKIVLPEKAPMETLDCATCHTSHEEQAKPSAETCISCHPSIENVGQHSLHLQFVESDCLQCHQPHSWSITEEWAQEECAKCHEYQAPLTFIQAKQE